MSSFTIGEVAQRAQIASSAIRYYEREGLIPCALRRSGRRVYDEEIFRRLALIQIAKRSGFSIAEIKHLIRSFTPGAPPRDGWRRLGVKKLEEIEGRIAEAKRMREILRKLIECKCPSPEACTESLVSVGERR